MAPEIAFREVVRLEKESVVLDPMSGSGMALRITAEHGHLAKGFDTDPLAVAISKVWTTPIDLSAFRGLGKKMISEAKELKNEDIYLPWIDNNEKAKDFINFWFAQNQISDLRKIAFLLNSAPHAYKDALFVALSRLIIRKNNGASLAADISHSRPHKVKTKNGFDTFSEYLKSVEFISKRIEEQPPPGSVTVQLGDARDLRQIDNNSIDMIITSPPYLNAIDYIRGHKFSLIWYGTDLDKLREIRSSNVGAERKADLLESERPFVEEVLGSLKISGKMSDRQTGFIKRYISDMEKILSEVARVLKKHGKAVIVIGNNSRQGNYVRNDSILIACAKKRGLDVVNKRIRKIPQNRRYLPPPSSREQSELRKRMRQEVILTFAVS